MLTNHVPPFPIHEGEPARAGDRAKLVVQCEVRQPGRPWQLVVLEDLSASGFRIAGLRDADQAQDLTIRIPGMQPLYARVCWKAGAQVGCEFTNPLHIAVFEHLIRKARGER